MNASTIIGVRLDGEVPPVDPCLIDVVDPASGQVMARVQGGGRRDAARAVDAAAATLCAWRAVPGVHRAAALRRIADRLDAQVDGDLPALITAETGKRLAESRGEVGFSAAYFRWFATLADGTASQTWQVNPGLHHHVGSAPVGVVAVLTPWNFPLSIPARKIAPALAAGCPVVFKPSEIAPVSGLRLAELVEAELPAGVLATVAGDAQEITGIWLGDPRVRAVSFTGSTRVGGIIASQAAGAFTRTVLELGGKATFLVLPDADIDEAVATLMVAKYRNNGQSCIAADSVWIADALHDRFVEAFAAASANLVVGDPMDPSTTLGPTALPGDPARLAALADDAAGRGAEVLRPVATIPSAGYFCAPLIVVEPSIDSVIATEEIFGPVVTVRRYTEVEDAIAATNAGRHGLAGYVVGTDVDAAHRMARRLDVGIAGVNTGTPNTPQVPFGGTKDSGIGYEGGAAGYEAFLRHQTIAVPASR